SSSARTARQLQDTEALLLAGRTAPPAGRQDRQTGATQAGGAIMMNGPPRFRTLGLLGGMGPSATADVLCKIIEVTPAARDQDHIPVLVRNVPQVPDRTQALLGSGASPQSALIAGARALRLAGADFLAIACNT